MLKIAVKRKKDAILICKWGAGWTGKTIWNARHALRGKLLLAFSVQGRSAGPEAGRGVPTPPSLPLDSTHPATGQGLLALDNPKEVGSHRKKSNRFAQTGCGAQRPLRALSGTRVLLTAAPTAPPCIRRRRRSSLLRIFLCFSYLRLRR